MANHVKIKAGLTLFSIIILILIPLVESNFNTPVVIKRWGKLSWNDFQGLPRPFSSYGAGISSRVYLEYDSTADRYIAYAGQHNVRSWSTEDATNTYALNHEQYHFNITEIHARKLNEYINSNPDEREFFYKLRLQSIWSDAKKMQRTYDKVSNHSLIRDQQRRSEYKIDSLLTKHSSDSGWIQDNYSGARAYFPVRPAFEEGSVSDGVYRNFYLSKYDMILSLVSFQYGSVDVHSLANSLRQFYQDQSLAVKNFEIEHLPHLFKAVVMAKDSLQNTLLNVWLYDNAYMFKLSAAYPTNTRDTVGYVQIAKSFLNSFSIKNTDSYWLENLKDIQAPRIVERINNAVISNEKDATNCLVYKKQEQYGFYRGPMYDDDGSLVIAYDAIQPAHSRHLKDVLVIDQHQYHMTSDSSHLFVVPHEKLPSNLSAIKLGYIATADDAKDCPAYYYQTLEN